MSVKKTILVTGATGYIGGSFLSHLLQRPDASSFEFRAVIRSTEKAEKIKAFGVNPIVGSHSDRELMSKAASEADIVITMADCDDLDAAEAILDGLKKRYKETGNRSILIHTVTNLIDNTDGKHASDVIYDDENVEQIESLPPTNPHRHVDTRVVAADQEGYVRTYIVVPSVVYTPARNALVDAGISSSSVLIFNVLVPIALQRGRGFIVGAGKNVWPNIDIDEVVDIYNRLFDSVLKDPEATPHGREGYYFGSSGEHTVYDVYKGVTQALFELGKVESPEPTPLTKDELDRYLGAAALGFSSNSRCISNRARKLGWKPTKSNKDFLATIRREVEERVKNIH
ncbi:NAD-binding protein [Moniliophthora roreri]|nr:NAD-binding protein [Moniliophthora roreri]